MTTTKKWLIGILCVLIATAGVYFGFRGLGGDSAAPVVAAAGPAKAVGPLSPPVQGKASPNSAEELAALANMEKAAENNDLALYVNRETAEIAVRQKKDGYVWFSNPVGKENDAIASPLFKSEMASQLTVTYYNSKGQLSTFNSYDESVRKKQFTISQTPDGINIEYVIGKVAAPTEGIPKAISKQRMEEKILSRLDDEEMKKSLLYKYRYDEKKQLYTARTMNNHVAEEVALILEKAGYTKEDAAWDNEENGLGGAGDAVEAVQFTVPLHYSLQDDQVVVSVPLGEVKYPKSFPIASIGVLKYFGSAGGDKQGYMLVPDGSGALIRLNNGKLAAEPLTLPIYGPDGTYVVKEKVQENEVSRLPVFGMKQNDRAFIGIIEDGDALASITADISGRYGSYNSIGTDYQLITMDYYTLTSGTRSSSVPMFQKQPYSGNIQIRYAFADGAAADYVGMATLYRSYLVQKYDLKPLSEEEKSPFVLEVAGAFRKQKSFLGVPYQSTEALTTFDETKQLLDLLRNNDVSRVALRYVGWFNGGIRHDSPADINPSGVLGGTKGLKQLADYAKNNGVELFPDTAFLQAYKNTKTAAEFLNRNKAKVYEYDPIMHTQDMEKFSHYIVSTAKLSGIVDGFLNDYKKLGIGGLSLRDLGGEVNSDYTPSHPVDRQSALETIEGELYSINNATNSVMVSTGNAYSLPYAKWVVHAPTRSSGMNLVDEDVPFYQIALHGYFQLAGEPFNMAGDQNPRLSMLKALETGSNVYYQWFFNEPSVVKDTDFNGLYALYYKDWFDEAVSIYQEADKVLGSVGNQPIVGHRKLADGVYMTVFAGGQTVTVNYNQKAVTVGGVTIDPQSYSTQVNRDLAKGGE
ncbi:DUF5696 domain-containing protein [Paenibacillus thermotolerans]|uniref:DUF5696 domain-containing protein n=1 Tax=Paenibacillus thermotolerans TaxID=3027807 RepID=UPI002368A0BE|nr:MULTISPECIES: DUF5696 domain-containing protein [unclassified Paenibacillus]